MGWRRVISEGDPARRLRSRRGRFLISLLVGGAVLGGGALLVLSRPAVYAASMTVVVVGGPSIAQLENATGETIDPTTQSSLARMSTTVVSDTLARVYRGFPKQRDLRSGGFDGRLEVTTKSSVISDTPDHGPVLVFVTEASTPNAALANISILADDLTSEIALQQRGSNPELAVSVAVVSTSDAAVQVRSSRARAGLAFFFLAWLAALMTWAGLRGLTKGQRTDDHVAESVRSAAPASLGSAGDQVVLGLG